MRDMEQIPSVVINSEAYHWSGRSRSETATAGRTPRATRLWSSMSQESANIGSPSRRTGPDLDR